ncbi:MAG: hypothetical protein ACKVU1_02250 [bacterium]
MIAGLTDGQKRALFAAVILIAFFAVDRLFVRAQANTLAMLESKLRGMEDQIHRRRSSAAWAELLAQSLGATTAIGDSSVSQSAIDDLNGLLKKRGLQKLELGVAELRGARGEPYQMTLRGNYNDLVCFLCDLESAPGNIWVRDFRISRPDGTTDLEMRVRVDVEREST